LVSKFHIQNFQDFENILKRGDNLRAIPSGDVNLGGVPNIKKASPTTVSSGQNNLNSSLI
jgi:hypothetical protein